jgi:glucose 1-dehydrogenase
MSTLNLQNKVALITGAGSGIGFEIARQLAREGAKVVLNDINEDLATSKCDIIQNEGGVCTAHNGDVSIVEVINQLIDLTVLTYGQIDIVIANAGITTFGPFLEYLPESMQKLLQLNIAGTFFLVQAAAKQMIAQEQGGSILMTSSVTGHTAHQFLEVYGMVKAGIDRLAKNLVIELSPHQININTIAPGATITERTIKESGSFPQVWYDITPTGKPCTVEDIAHAALFFVSPNSRQITGQNLVIDGGWSSVATSPYK